MLIHPLQVYTIWGKCGCLLKATYYPCTHCTHTHTPCPCSLLLRAPGEGKEKVCDITLYSHIYARLGHPYSEPSAALLTLNHPPLLVHWLFPLSSTLVSLQVSRPAQFPTRYTPLHLVFLLCLYLVWSLLLYLLALPHPLLLLSNGTPVNS